MSMISKTFCPLPFVQASTDNDGSYRLCCHSKNPIQNDDGSTAFLQTHKVDDVWNNQYYSTIREQMQQGVRPKSCATCYKLEDKGQVSYRQKYLSSMPIEHKEGPSHLEIKVGSLCNLKCVMCYPGASSLHQHEVEVMLEQGIEPPNAFNLDNTDLTIAKEHKGSSYADNLNLKDCTRICLTGGEPLVNKTTLLILDRCINEGHSKHIALEIITNLTTLNKAVIDRLVQFNHAKLLVSWDHVDAAKAHYMRYPKDYNQFYKNLLTVLDTDIEVAVSSCITIFNIFDIKEIFDKWQSLNIKQVHLEIVYFPLYFNVEYLTQEQLLLVSKQIDMIKNQSYDFMTPLLLGKLESIQKMTSINDINVLNERNRVIDLYDKLRGTDARSLFSNIS